MKTGNSDYHPASAGCSGCHGSGWASYRDANGVPWAGVCDCRAGGSVVAATAPAKSIADECREELEGPMVESDCCDCGNHSMCGASGKCRGCLTAKIEFLARMFRGWQVCATCGIRKTGRLGHGGNCRKCSGGSGIAPITTADRRYAIPDQCQIDAGRTVTKDIPIDQRFKNINPSSWAARPPGDQLLLTIVGNPGTKKTTFAAYLATIAQDEGFSICWLRAADLGGYESQIADLIARATSAALTVIDEIGAPRGPQAETVWGNVERVIDTRRSARRKTIAVSVIAITQRGAERVGGESVEEHSPKLTAMMGGGLVLDTGSPR